MQGYFVLAWNEYKISQRNPVNNSSWFLQVFDKDGNGYIDPQEMRLAIKEQGLGLSEQDVKEMVEKAGCQVPDRLYYDGS